MRASDRGSTTLELVIWTPALLLLIAAVVLAGRVAQARLTVEAAASEAARAATAAPSLAGAEPAAVRAAEAALGSAGLRCAPSSVAVDASQWLLPPGVPGRVTTTVTCQVPLDDLGMPGLAGVRTVQASASSALDTYRARL
jgi:Flp pilus assembly protein TadG